MFKHLHQLMQVATVGLAVSLSGAAVAGAVSGQGTWESTLQGRDINHDGVDDAYYDSSLKVTWLANAFAEGPPPGMPVGRPILFWGEAREWVRDLNVFGLTGWRLPNVVNDPMATAVGFRSCPSGSYDGADHGLCGYNSDTSQSEMSHMFYVTLGNKAPMDAGGLPQVGSGLTNTGPFQNLLPAIYWTGTRNDPGDFVWTFAMASGAQGVTDPYGGFRTGVWAVRDGDIGAVPEPESLALTLSGGMLVGWLLHRRRRDQNSRSGF